MLFVSMKIACHWKMRRATLVSTLSTFIWDFFGKFTISGCFCQSSLEIYMKKKTRSNIHFLIMLSDFIPFFSYCSKKYDILKPLSIITIIFIPFPTPYKLGFYYWGGPGGLVYPLSHAPSLDYEKFVHQKWRASGKFWGNFGSLY